MSITMILLIANLVATAVSAVLHQVGKSNPAAEKVAEDVDAVEKMLPASAPADKAAK